jgi:hypothetical protein
VEKICVVLGPILLNLRSQFPFTKNQILKFFQLQALRKTRCLLFWHEDEGVRVMHPFPLYESKQSPWSHCCCHTIHSFSHIVSEPQVTPSQSHRNKNAATGTGKIRGSTRHQIWLVDFVKMVACASVAGRPREGQSSRVSSPRYLTTL